LNIHSEHKFVKCECVALRHNKILINQLILAYLSNGVYWQPSTDIKNEGNFINDPDIPNDREGTVISWITEFAKAVFMFGTNSICYQRPKAGYET
jgi:hypothetical protein